MTQMFIRKLCQGSRVSFFCLIACWAVLCPVLLLAMPSAQALSPTPEQIEQFKRLSPAEQKALAASMGIEIPANLGTAGAPVVTNPKTVEPREVSAQTPVKTHEPNKGSTGQADKSQVASVESKLDQTTEAITLKPFGYDLFAGSPSTFAPATDIPVPGNYAIGPGDTMIVQLYGKENATYELAVTREGKIQFPEIGPISVNGLNFGELRARIDELVSEQMIGVKASVTMGALRSIRVFVLGEAYKPGSYTISALSSVTHALFASGGIKDIGSLRNIQLKRQGEVVATLDLYDLLLKGDTSADVRLLPGDVVFVPTVGKTAAVTGAVRRPAIYEIKGKARAQDLLTLAGGALATAYPEASRLERIDHKGRRTVEDIDLNKPSGKQTALRDGDVLKIYSVLDRLENVVVVSGHVQRPGFYKWRKGLRVKDVVGSVSDLSSNPDLRLALIKHETGPERMMSFDVIDLGAALAGKAEHNRALKPRDEVMVFGAGDQNRAERLADFVAVLNQQAPAHAFAETAEIVGDVKSPGVYPIAKKMDAATLVSLAGGLLPDAQKTSALLVERTQRPGRFDIRYVSLSDFNSQPKLAAGARLFVLSNVNDRADLLEPIITEIKAQSWQGDHLPLVSLNGAVRFPGEYPYMQGSTVGDVIALAGGLREEAYLLSGELTRSTISQGDSFSISHAPLDLTQTDETGLGKTLEPRDGLTIKSIPEWEEMSTVMVQGEVRFPGRYPIKRGETLTQLLERAGGLTDAADAKGTVFLRESLREKEAEALENLKQQLEGEVTRLESESASSDSELAEQRAASARLLADLNQAQALGRLVIDLPGMLSDKKSVSDVVLRPGDEITVPQLIQEVSIVGEVNYPTSHLHQKKWSGRDYLKKSGGFTRNADVKRAYVISRSGDVKPLRKWKFFFLSAHNRVQSGDTIVVPVDVDKVSPMVYWGQVSQILFQLATTAAALQTVGAI